MAEVQSSGASSSSTFAQDTTITLPEIDQQGYAYYVKLVLPASSNLEVNGVRIDYGYTTVLSLILK